MLTIVYAPAHNELRMSVTSCSSYKKAINLLRSVFGEDTPYKEKKVEGKRTFRIGNNGRFETQHFYRNGKRREEPITYYRCDEITPEQSRKLFTRYYGGCGECYSIIAQEIDDSEVPLFPFDQD